MPPSAPHDATLDVIASAICVSLFLGYQVFLAMKLRKNPVYTVQAATKRARVAWVGFMMEHESRALLAVQTLRNSTMLEVLATETLALKLGVFDGAGQTGLATGRHGPKTFYGNPSDLFVVAQADTTWGDGVRPGRLGVGYWQHTGEFARFDGDTDEHARGTYLVLDQDLGPLRDRGALGGYLQLGFADGDVSEVESHLGLGLVWSEFLEGRDDAVGVGLTHVSLSSEAEFDEDSELTVELFWRTAPAGWLLLKPDLQYVFHPGGDSSLDDAWILGLRAELSLF